MNQSYDINFAMTALAEAGWNPVQTDQHWLLLTLQGSGGPFFISFSIHPEDYMLSARGNIPVYVAREKEPQALEFINYSNYRTQIGNFEFDVASQQIFFRVGLFFEHTVLNAQLLHNVVNEIGQNVQAFWPAIKAIVQDDMSVRDAFELATSA